ncbi:RES domain-containing protein [Mycobacterium malmoense]|uniref:RES domain-containing protein n=1 Tax=Mycobacterium malmoense TaxID=1780 RepID=UPI00111C1D4F|nr:RES domain-containing protein [Mycobacterium malmoense]QZA16379.1 RES domain-containing protein [Mycobacterium malmoense]UNB93182.1 RES domain-containing protein [Mycobacterium malmoense]
MPADAVRIRTVFGLVHGSRVDALPVYRVGYKPDPWHWTPWEFADEHGRFTGRWDDPAGIWRTLYAGSSALACYLEVLAVFRADPVAARGMDDIAVEDADDLYPAIRPGEIPRAWREPRSICSAELSGWFVLVGHYETLPTLRRQFLPMAKEYGLQDLDAAAIRDGKHRRLTQAMSAWIYTLSTPNGDPTTGIQFDSRHGDQLTLWAIYERSASTASPPEIANYSGTQDITEQDADLTEAMHIHHLTWAT